MFTKWKLGGYALGVLQWAGDVARSIDPEAAFRVAAKVIEIERERRGTPGAQKLNELLEWFGIKHDGPEKGRTIGRKTDRTATNRWKPKTNFDN